MILKIAPVSVFLSAWLKPGLVEPIPRYGFLPGARGMFVGFPGRSKSQKRVLSYSLS